MEQIKTMDFKKYQDLAQSVAIYPNKGINLTYPVIGLSGEAGEVAEKFKKVLRDNNGEITQEIGKSIALELGDCLWYISDIAFELGYSIEEIAIMNIEKLFSRKKRGKLSGSGDNR